jgi:hypothetical protein
MFRWRAGRRRGVGRDREGVHRKLYRRGFAQRELMEHLRSFGEGGGGPKPLSAADRSRF